jgi:predicted ATPase/DNA-binding CsgD family transcriptional regulator
VKEQWEAILQEPLTARELEILHLIAQGLSNRAIAERLVVSIETVKWYNKRLYAKLYVGSRTQAVARARTLGLLKQPAGHSPAALPHPPLPAPLTSLLGREQDVAVVRSLLQTNRLLTLTGPGGAGKTRLALQVAAEAAAAYQDGVVFVDLSALDDPAIVLDTVAKAVGVVEQPGESLQLSVQHFLARKQMLLLLDNFEHLLPAALLVAGWLANAPRLSFLITSRESLRLNGEQQYLVAPLALPVTEADLPLVLQAPATRLFFERARAVRPDFELDQHNVAAVVQICTLLDGLPLAIELAAARSRLFPPDALLSRLRSYGGDHRGTSALQLLSEGMRDLPARQQTLRATIDWSYHLLLPQEQALFRRLAVFAGGWTLPAAAAVCDPDGSGSGRIVELLSSLVDKNLLRLEEGPDGEPRLWMLHVIREYASERLERLGEAARARQQHAQFYVSLAMEIEGKRRGPDQAVWWRRLQAEQDNLRAGLSWVMQHASVEFGLRAAPAFLSSRFWRQRDQLGQVRAWLDHLLATGDNAAPQLYATALDTAARLAYTHQDYPATIELGEKSLVLHRRLGDMRAIVNSLAHLGGTKMELGRGDEALRDKEECLAIARQLDDLWLTGRSMLQLGALLTFRRDFARAELHLEEALQLALTVQNPHLLASALFRMGGLESHRGDYARARDYFLRALDTIRQLPGSWLEADAIKALGKVAMRARDFQEATAYLVQALTMFIEFSTWRVDGPECLESLARVAFEQNHDEHAVQLWGAANAIRSGWQPWPIDREYMEQAISRARERMPPGAFDRAWRDGQWLAQQAREAPETLIAFVSPSGQHPLR